MSKLDIIHELHKPARRNFPRRHVKMKGIDDLWQADLVEMIPYSKNNKNYKYLLTVIDTFSKYAWGIPLKNKKGITVAKSMEKIFKTSRRKPRNLQTDQGKEFFNECFQKVMNKHFIKHYSTFSVLKASIVERFNRTLKEKMWKQFSLQGSYKWVHILPFLINEYNKQYHRTIKRSPIEVTKTNEAEILNTIYKRSIKLIRGKFKIGDFVRVSKFKTKFSKGYTPNWSTEIFRIKKVNHKEPITYLLADLNEKPVLGCFYEYELLKTKYPYIYLVEEVLRKRKNMVYVKWLGMDNSFNSWISKSQIIE